MIPEELPLGLLILPDFNAQSRNGSVCSLSNLPKQRPELGKQAHEVDEFIIRGPQIDFEGYFDMRPSALREIAMSLLGMVPATAVETVQAALEQAESERDDAQAAQTEAQVYLEISRNEVADLRVRLNEAEALLDAVDDGLLDAEDES